MEKYRKRQDIKLNSQDESAVIKGFQLLQSVSRRICHLQDYRIFKQFIYNNKEHQQTILDHAISLSDFLKSQNSANTKFSCPTLNVSGYLQFLSTAPFA